MGRLVWIMARVCGSVGAHTGGGTIQRTTLTGSVQRNITKSVSEWTEDAQPLRLVNVFAKPAGAPSDLLPHSQPRAPTTHYCPTTSQQTRPSSRCRSVLHDLCECQSAGSALRLTARAPSRARLRAVGQAPRAGLVLVEVGVRHVERHSRLRPPDELAALHALLNDGSRHAGSHPP